MCNFGTFTNKILCLVEMLIVFSDRQGKSIGTHASRSLSPTLIALTPISQTALMMGKRISIDEKVLYELFVKGWLSKEPVLITINTGSVYSLISRACVERCGLRKYVTRGRINACLLTLGGATIEVMVPSFL